MRHGISKKSILYFLILLPFFAPDGLTTIGESGFVVNAGILNNQLIIFFTSFLFRLRNMIGILILLYAVIKALTGTSIGLRYLGTYHKISIFYCLFCICLLISSFVNNIEMYNVYIVVIYSLGCVLMLEHLFKKDSFQAVITLTLIMRIMLLLNAFFIILFPNGITTGMDYLSTPYYFLGQKNQVTPMLIFAIMLEFTNLNYLKHKKINSYFFMLVIIFNVVYMNSSTSLISCFLLIVVYLIGKDMKEIKSFFSKDKKRILVIIFALTIGVVFFHIQDYFKWLVVGILGKDISFSSRTKIWQVGIEQISARPMWGYGYGYRVWQSFYAHNLILELLVIAGVLGCLFYLLIILTAVENIRMKNRMVIISVISIGAIMLTNITEAFIFNTCQLSIFVTAFFSDYIEKAFEDLRLLEWKIG